MELTDAITIDASEPVSQAISKIKESGLGVLVFEGKKYVGMVDERQLREKKFDPAKAKVGNMVVKTPTLSPQSSVQEICRAFFAGRFKALPVIDGGKVLGLVGRWDILSMLEKGGDLKGQKVMDHMTSPIMSVDFMAPVSVANALMRDANVRRLAVIENGRLVGLVSVFDLLHARSKQDGSMPRMNYSKQSRQEDLPIYSFMKTNVETIRQEDSLSDAVRQMISTGKAALVVADEKRPVGIITAKDILEASVRKEMKMPVGVSGLHGVDKSISEDIMDEGERFLERMKSSVGAEALSIHVKNTGAEYQVSAHVHGKIPLRSGATEFELMEAVREALDELRGQAERVKGTRMAKRKE